MSLSDVIIDILILVLPIVPILQLNMELGRKITLLFVFALGIFSIAAGMTRMILLMEILTYRFGSNDMLFGLRGTSDSLGVLSTVIWWSVSIFNRACSSSSKLM